MLGETDKLVRQLAGLNVDEEPKEGASKGKVQPVSEEMKSRRYKKKRITELCKDIHRDIGSYNMSSISRMREQLAKAEREYLEVHEKVVFVFNTEAKMEAADAHRQDVQAALAETQLLMDARVEKLVRLECSA